MAFIQLNIPVLVRYSHASSPAQFIVRPLFAPYPVAADRQHTLAASIFKKEVRQYFKGYNLSRQSADQLMWLIFNPKMEYRQYPLECNVAGLLIKGTFSAVSFDIQGSKVFCLPRFNHFMFIAHPDQPAATQVEKVVRQLLKQIREEQGSAFDPADYYADKKEYITHINVNVPIGRIPFKFDRQSAAFQWAHLRELSNFDGATELEKVGQDLNDRYPTELQRAYHRESEVEWLYQILFREGKTPVAIIGNEGVGKHTLVQEAIWRYQHHIEESGGEPNQRVWHIDPNRIVTGMSYVGMWQSRFEAILQYLETPGDANRSSDKLLIDNPIALLRIGKSAQSNMTLSDVLRPYLENRRLQVILIATPSQWSIIQEKDRRFSDLFQLIPLREPDYVTTIKMILEYRRHIEEQYDVVFSMHAIRTLLNLQRSFFRHQAFPGSVTRIMQQLAQHNRFSEVDVEDVESAFYRNNGLAGHLIDTYDTLEDHQLHYDISRELVGQPRAVEALSNAVHLLKARLSDTTKPVSSFLFVGPTGVGKTQAAKIMSNILTGGDNLLRLDMNEYSDPYAVSRLIGDFMNPEGQLTGQVKYRPFGVLLLDEIEKAHPKVLDLLLQVLDDARLTDSQGQTIDFSNLMIIMTSNVGAKDGQSVIGLGNRSASEYNNIYRKAIERAFRPEFINRIDEIVMFDPLELVHIQGIARLQIRELLRRDGLVRRTTILNISKPALDWVAFRGFDANLGGRALRRQIENDLTTLTSEQLLNASPNQPIILNINLEGDKLSPEIICLEFARRLEFSWMPVLPEFKKEKPFYQHLFRQIEALQQRVNNIKGPSLTSILSGENTAEWHFFHYKNLIDELADRLKNRLLATLDHLGPPPLRLKPNNYAAAKEGPKVMRDNLKDWFFQRDAIKELSESYQYGLDQFDGLNTKMIADFLDVTFLLGTADEFANRRLEKIALVCQSCVDGMGEKETEFLLKQYAGFLQLYDIATHIDEKTATLTAEGYGLAKWLASEAGIHLFYLGQQHPLPVRIILQEPAGMLTSNTVLRVYDKGRTITDLRTGFSNAENMTAREFQLLVYAGMMARHQGL